MQEIEAKFKVKDHRVIRERLIAMGAELIWKGREESYFFDTARRDLDKKGEQLRLRSWPGHSVMLTFKKRVDRKEKRYKIRGEYELHLPDIKQARAFIEAMGYKEYFRYYKQREHYKLGEVFVELDRLSGLHFVEVEASRPEIERIAKALELNWDDAMTKGYVTIVRELMGQPPLRRGFVRPPARRQEQVATTPLRQNVAGTVSQTAPRVVGRVPQNTARIVGQASPRQSFAGRVKKPFVKRITRERKSNARPESTTK